MAGLFTTFMACSKDKITTVTDTAKREVFNIYPQPAVNQNASNGREDGWVGDVMPYYLNGQFEIFFLHDATDLAKYASSGQHAIHKFISKNLLDFTYNGEMIRYGNKATQDHLIGTGGLINAGGTYYFYYTGHNGNSNWLSNNNPGWTNTNDREAIMCATSTNLTTWTKNTNFLLRATDGYSNYDFRDPYVFYNDEFAEYWMLVSTKQAGKGVILVYKTTSPATNQWTIRGTLNVEGDYGMLECSDIFKLGDKYYMLFAEDWSGAPGTHYRVASSTAGPWLKPTGGQDMFDGHEFYAGRSASDGTNTYAFGWAHRRNNMSDSEVKNWGGNLITHQIYKLPNNKLAVKTPDAIKNYFGKEANATIVGQAGTVNQTGNSYTINGTAAKALYKFDKINGTSLIKGTITLGNTTGTATFGFNTQADNSSTYTIKLAPGQNRIAAYNNDTEVTRVPFTFQNGTTYSFNIVVDGSVVILYLNNEVALTNRIYNAQGNAWSVAADNMQITLQELKIGKKSN